MEDLVPVFDKDAHALPIAEPRRRGPVVEDQGLELVCPEGDGVVEIEVVAMGGEPREAPAHPLPVARDLVELGARDGDHRHIACVQVHDDRIEVVDPERAMLTGLAPLGVRVEHEVVDHELPAPVEEIGQALLTVGPVEDVFLLDALPRQLAPLPAQLVAQPRELLLLGESEGA